MEFIIHPYIGAGKIEFGMSSGEVQELLAAKPEKFRKYEDDEYDTDAYEWCHVFYKKPGVCEAIEFYKPASIIFRGKNLLGRSYSEVKDFVSEVDDELLLDDTGFTSLKFGFGVYAPFAENEPLEPVEGVIVFEKGYYD